MLTIEPLVAVTVTVPVWLDTVTVTGAVAVKPSPVAVIVSGYEPAATVLPTAIFKVEVPEALRLVVDKVAVIPAGAPETASPILPLNEPPVVTVAVEVADPPGPSGMVAGDVARFRVAAVVVVVVLELLPPPQLAITRIMEAAPENASMRFLFFPPSQKATPHINRPASVAQTTGVANGGKFLNDRHAGAAAVAPGVTVSVAVPEPVTEPGMEQVVFVTPDTAHVNVTVPLKLPDLATVTVAEPGVPRVRVRLVGLMDTPKSASHSFTR